MRASWKGYLTVNLVTFQVEAYNSLESGRGEIHFHQLHKKDHQRIRYKKSCPVHGEVGNEEIVTGYEYAKGKYVEIDPGELDELRTKRERSLNLDSFVPADQIDPIYFDGRSYYLAPVGQHSSEPYALVHAAMQKLERWGVGQVIFAGREQLVVVRPVGDVLVMELLNYPEQIRSAELLRFERAKVEPKKEKLAEQLIEAATEEDFDLSHYHDHYQAKLKELIQAKVEGREVVAPEQPDEPEVINLMDALRKSVQASQRRQGGKSRPAKRTARATTAKRARRKRA